MMKGVERRDPIFSSISAKEFEAVLAVELLTLSSSSREPGLNAFSRNAG